MGIQAREGGFVPEVKRLTARGAGPLTHIARQVGAVGASPSTAPPSPKSTHYLKFQSVQGLRRFDRVALAGKVLGGLEGLLPTHPLRGRTPAGIVVEGEPPHERAVV